MNEFRAAFDRGEAAGTGNPCVSRDAGRRRGQGSLSGALIPREERRTTNQRREERYRGLVDRASLCIRGKTMLVKVVNLSESGLMIETSIEAHIGEAVRVAFKGCAPLDAVVRWVRDGRIGLDVGEGAISLG